MRTSTLALSLLLAACTSNLPKTPPGASPDLATPGSLDLAGVAPPPDFAHAGLYDLAGVADGGVPCGGITSPSGYKCDAWSVHTYVARFVSATSSTLRLELWHD